MGNEKSNLGHIEIKPEVIEVANSWTLKQAICTASSAQYSVFCSPADSAGYLELAAKNLKIYRHPGILKFVQTWSQSGYFNLATEQVLPLSQELGAQTNLQVCLGLRSILRALVFLHDTAKVSHTNVCCGSIYVSPDNTWKLGNFEFITKYNELNSENLRKIRNRRYEFAIPPEENAGAHVDPQALDSYAFGIMVQEILKKRDLTSDPSGLEFFKLACEKLQDKQIKSRGSLAELLEHPYFSHPVVEILEFLSAITLKTISEKEQFFRSLWAQLATLPEVMVATQLADLLLSRLVLLEPSAQTYLVPWLLAIKDENATSGSFPSGDCSPLFSRSIFEKFVSPKLVKIFQVHDSQVRCVLLKHFSSYCHGFTKEQLQHNILPELLVGIKDNDDLLVSTTLRALADLVPILGAATVIGGKRGKLFTDGRPKVRPVKRVLPVISPKPAAPTARVERVLVQETGLNADLVENGVASAQLPERLSPDGGEAWSDWDDQQDEDEEKSADGPENGESTLAKLQTSPALKKPLSLSGKIPTNIVKNVVDDLDALDIKAAKITVVAQEKEMDFFQDMEPVIATTKNPLFPGAAQVEKETTVAEKSKFSMAVSEDFGEEAGWGDDGDFSDWGEVGEDDAATKEAVQVNLTLD
ncbi:protein-associating with the carboxyl-terminal domain of ezrin [Neocloeon triangulifer]|uniref:protein-associating with the carboxyl-terminal domain of ezrin n=1 Tax=Neocloeon triangulifer TaxID=2078957 RepID=UPI00286EE471|nr:protein-associating with the carboxyl-terminal domain of ezrin [Neocloeon triangulifer]